MPFAPPSPLANVALTDTFDLWRTRYNQSVTYLNTFASNTLSLVSNSATLTISGNGQLGSNVYFDIGTLSTNVLDQAVGNIASANSVYTAYNITYTAANTAQYKANLAFDQANTARNHANAAYNQANTGDTTGAAAFGQANTARDQANTARDQANTVFGFSNTAQYTANLAFDKANTAGGGFFRGNDGDKGQASNKGDLFRINYSFLGSNVGFDNGENALTTGPITINTGRYLIINTGARVVIA